VASYDLIDSYLGALAGRLRWRHDVDELIAELGDHLYSATEQLELDGRQVEVAQRKVLDRFGSAECVATALVTTPGGGVAVPTRFTQRSGRAAVVGAAAWPSVATGWWLSMFLESRTGRWEGGARLAYVAGNAALLVATMLTVVVVVGLNRRHGGIGLLGVAGVIFAVLAAVLSVFGWFVIGWGLLSTIAAALIGIGAMRIGIAPLLPAAAFASAWVLGAAVWCGLRALEVGGADEWGNYAVADLSALTVGSVVMTFGLVGLGRWLKDESPAEQDLLSHGQ
jgi:hypothetical protein